MSESKFKVGSFWRRRDGLKAEILANGIKCLDGMSIVVKIYGPRKYAGFLYSNGKKYGEHECFEDLIEPWVEKKKVKLSRWLVKDYCVDRDDYFYFITAYQSYPTLVGEVIREYDSIEVEV